MLSVPGWNSAAEDSAHMLFPFSGFPLICKSCNLSLKLSEPTSKPATLFQPTRQCAFHLSVRTHSRGWQKLLFQDDDTLKIVKTLVYKLFPLKWGDWDQEFFKEIIQNDNYEEWGKKNKLLDVELFTKHLQCNVAVAMQLGCGVRVMVFKKRQVFIVSLTIHGGQT